MAKSATPAKAAELVDVLSVVREEKANLEDTIRKLLLSQEERLGSLIRTACQRDRLSFATMPPSVLAPTCSQQQYAGAVGSPDESQSLQQDAWDLPGQPACDGYRSVRQGSLPRSSGDRVEEIIPRIKSMKSFEEDYEAAAVAARTASSSKKLWTGFLNTTGSAGTDLESLGVVRRSCLKLISTSGFEWLVSFLIVLNTVVLGFQADWAVRNAGEEVPAVYAGFEFFFVVAFTIELIMRIVAYGSFFFNLRVNQDIRWNLFDFTLVVISLSEFVLHSSGVYLFKANITRMLRLSRLVRAMRVIRIVRFFSEIRIMVLAIGSSIKLLFWASLLLTMLMYLFAVLFMNIAEEKLAEVRGTQEETGWHADALRLHWGSLGAGIYTLYLSITGGINWGIPAEPLLELSPWFAIIFCGYMAIAVFCVLNTVTGIFVEKANTIVSIDKESFLWHEMRKRKKWVEEVKTSFTRADTNGSGKLSWEEFEAQMKDVNVQMDLKALGIDVLETDPEILFDLFDFDGDGTIEIHEFATGVQKLHGKANAIDVASLKLALKFMQDDVDEIKALLSGLMNLHK